MVKRGILDQREIPIRVVGCFYKRQIIELKLSKTGSDLALEVVIYQSWPPNFVEQFVIWFK